LGWVGSAVGNGWAVFADSEEAAAAKFREAQQRHAQILSRKDPTEKLAEERQQTTKSRSHRF